MLPTFELPGITLDHLVARLEAAVGDVCDTQALVIGFVGRQDRRVRYQGEVDP